MRGLAHLLYSAFLAVSSSPFPSLNSPPNQRCMAGGPFLFHLGSACRGLQRHSIINFHKVSPLMMIASCSANLQIRFSATPCSQPGYRHGSTAQRPVAKGHQGGASATRKAPNSDPSPRFARLCIGKRVDHMSMTCPLLLNAESWRTIFCPSTGGNMTRIKSQIWH
jgi:hypothetical protein